MSEVSNDKYLAMIKGKDEKTVIYIDRSIKKHGSKYDYTPTIFLTAKLKVKILCLIHGIFEQRAHSHFSMGCKKCGNIQGIEKLKGRTVVDKLSKMTEEIFLERSNKFHSNKYSYDDVEYDGYNTEVIIGCPKHGKFKQSPKNHLKGGCRDCANELLSESRRMDRDEYVKNATEVHNGKYTYGEIIYEDERAYINVICPDHGKFVQYCQSHLRGHGCPECGFIITGSARRLPKEEVIKRFIIMHGNRYEYLDFEYTTVENQISIKCKKHGTFLQTVREHMSGSGCKKCKMPHGEQMINNYLTQLNIKFSDQKQFPGCRYILPLSYDFYVDDYNLCIEYNGEQHYKIVELYGGEKDYKIRIIRDNIKKEYAKNNNINLLIIPFTIKKNDDIIREIENEINNIKYQTLYNDCDMCTNKLMVNASVFNMNKEYDSDSDIDQKPRKVIKKKVSNKIKPKK